MPFFPRSRKSGRRREDDGIHAVGFELDSLEFVQASDELGLLRVGGRWVAPASRALGDIVLTVRRDSEKLELQPLPDMHGVAPVASPAGEEWRGAFTMTVEVSDDPRTEFVLVAGDDASVELPRPGEWEQLQEDGEPEPESPVVADLVAKLDDVARLEPEPQPDVSQTELAELRAERDTLRAERDVLRAELAAARSELEATRGRGDKLEHELESRASVEDDLRNAIAMQEAELASAVAQASQRARQAERRRDLAPPSDGDDHPESPRSRPADEDFVARLERARRASDAVAG